MASNPANFKPPITLASILKEYADPAFFPLEEIGPSRFPNKKSYSESSLAIFKNGKRKSPAPSFRIFFSTSRSIIISPTKANFIISEFAGVACFLSEKYTSGPRYIFAPKSKNSRQDQNPKIAHIFKPVDSGVFGRRARQ